MERKEHLIRLLRLLEDGKKYSVGQIAEALKLDRERVLELLIFFSKYGMVEFDEEGGVAKISSDMLELLKLK